MQEALPRRADRMMRQACRAAQQMGKTGPPDWNGWQRECRAAEASGVCFAPCGSFDVGGVHNVQDTLLRGSQQTVTDRLSNFPLKCWPALFVTPANACGCPAERERGILAGCASQDCQSNRTKALPSRLGYQDERRQWLRDVPRQCRVDQAPDTPIPQALKCGGAWLYSGHNRGMAGEDTVGSLLPPLWRDGYDVVEMKTPPRGAAQYPQKFAISRKFRC